MLVNDPLAPVQVEAGAAELEIVTPVGSVSAKLLWVSAKAFALCNVNVSVEGIVGPTLAGANACVTVGGTGVTCSAVGHAVLPALTGALLDALFEVTAMVATSWPPMLSVMVSVTVPAPGRIVALSLCAPETMLTPLAVQEYVAIVRPHEAALPLASSTASLPATMGGNFTAAMGSCAASARP